MAFASENTATPNTGAASWKIVKDATGGMYMEIALTTQAGTGTAPLSAAAHVVRIPVSDLVS